MSVFLEASWHLAGTAWTCSMTPYDIKGLKRPPPTWPHAMCIFFMHCSIKKGHHLAALDGRSSMLEDVYDITYTHMELTSRFEQ